MKPFLILSVFTLLSCTNENKTSSSEDIDSSSPNQMETIHGFHHFRFDSLQIQDDLMIRAYIDSVSKSDYFLVADYQGQKDTLQLSHLYTENTFPRIIWNGESWESVYHHPTNNRFYFTLNFFTVEKLGALEIKDNKPVFLFQEERLLTTLSAFIVSINGLEVPIVRGEKQGYSRYYSFDFQAIGNLFSTSNKIRKLIDAIPL